MRSMTGCGRCQKQSQDWEITVELRSVNHRYLDISMRLTKDLLFLEDTTRKAIQAGMTRGHVDVYLTVRNTATGGSVVQADTALARSYCEAAAQLAQATGIANTLTMADLMKMDGVLRLTQAGMDEELLTQLCREAVTGAVHELDDMRLREGGNLCADLAAHLDTVTDLRAKILARAPGVIEDYRTRLTERLARLPIEPVDPARLAQEVALMADKCAIDEELSRLESHISQMRSYLSAPGEIGKKMDFLIQEMNREANTIGSKASDAVIAQHVVDLKSAIEKLREQIQNVE